MPNNYALIEESTGLVTNVIVWDGESEYVPAAGLIMVESDEASIGWTYKDEVFVAPPVAPPAAVDIKAVNVSIRDSLLAQATAAMGPLQDAVDLDDANAEEISLLRLWKQYRVAVNRVDFSVQDPAWPMPPAR